MAYIYRTLEQKIMDISRDYSCLLLIGPRQVGKTTMLEHLMEGTERQKVTLDDTENRRLAQSDPALFLEMHPDRWEGPARADADIGHRQVQSEKMRIAAKSSWRPFRCSMQESNIWIS